MRKQCITFWNIHSDYQVYPLHLNYHTNYQVYPPHLNYFSFELRANSYLCSINLHVKLGLKTHFFTFFPPLLTRLTGHKWVTLSVKFKLQIYYFSYCFNENSTNQIVRYLFLLAKKRLLSPFMPFLFSN